MAKSLFGCLLLLSTPSFASETSDLDDANALLQSGASVIKANWTEQQYPPVKPGYSSGATMLLNTPGQRHRINSPRKGQTCGFSQGLLGHEMAKKSQYLDCSTPLPAGIPDMRGDWHYNGKLPLLGRKRNEHIEQCEDRILIVSDNAVMDFVHADGTFERGVQDYDERQMPSCFERVAAGTFDGAGCLTITDDVSIHPETALETRKFEKRCLDSDGKLVFKDRYNNEIKMHRWNKPNALGDQAANARVLRQQEKAATNAFDKVLKANASPHAPYAARRQNSEKVSAAASDSVSEYQHDEAAMASPTVRPSWADYPTESPLMAYQRSKSNLDEYYFNNPLARVQQNAQMTASDSLKKLMWKAGPEAAHLAN